MYSRKRNSVERGRLLKRSLTQPSGNNDNNNNDGTLVVLVNAGSIPKMRRFGLSTEDGNGNTVKRIISSDSLGGADGNKIDGNGGDDTTTTTTTIIVTHISEPPDPITSATQPTASTSAPQLISIPISGEMDPIIFASSALGTSSTLAGALLSSSSIVTTESAVTISQTASSTSTSSTVVTTTESTSTIASPSASISTATLTSTHNSTRSTPTSAASNGNAGSASGASKSSSAPIAAIIVVAVIVVLAITCLGVYYYRKRTANRSLLRHAAWTAALFPYPQTEVPVNPDYAFSNSERSGSTRNGFEADSGSRLAPSPEPEPYRAVSPAPPTYSIISPTPYGTVCPQYQYQYSQQQTHAPIAPPQMAYNTYLAPAPHMNNQYTSPAPSSAPSRKDAVVECSFIPTLPDELSISAGETIRVLNEYDDGWAQCANGRGEQGLVPMECLTWAGGEWQGEGLGQRRSQIGWRDTKRVSSLNLVGAGRY